MALIYKYCLPLLHGEGVNRGLREPQHAGTGPYGRHLYRIPPVSACGSRTAAADNSVRAAWGTVTEVSFSVGVPAGQVPQTTAAPQTPDPAGRCLSRRRGRTSTSCRRSSRASIMPAGPPPAMVTCLVSLRMTPPLPLGVRAPRLGRYCPPRVCLPCPDGQDTVRGIRAESVASGSNTKEQRNDRGPSGNP